jgi:hypothetical protein
LRSPGPPTTSSGKGQQIFHLLEWSGWNQLRKPSRPFLTLLAAEIFAGALLLTPPVSVTAPIRNSPGGALGIRPREARVSIDSTTWEREVVARYDHLPLAQILTNSADPEMANRVARAIVKEARELQLSPSLLTEVRLV